MPTDDNEPCRPATFVRPYVTQGWEVEGARYIDLAARVHHDERGYFTPQRREPDRYLIDGRSLRADQADESWSGPW